MKIAQAGPISFITAPCPSGDDNRERARGFLAPSKRRRRFKRVGNAGLRSMFLSERSKNSAELHHVARVVQPSEKPSHWTHGGRPRVPCQKSNSSVSLPSLPFWPEHLTPNLAEAVVAEATVSAVAEEWLVGSAEAECLTGSPEAVVVACRHPDSVAVPVRTALQVAVASARAWDMAEFAAAVRRSERLDPEWEGWVDDTGVHTVSATRLVSVRGQSRRLVLIARPRDLLDPL